MLPLKKGGIKQRQCTTIQMTQCETPQNAKHDESNSSSVPRSATLPAHCDYQHSQQHQRTQNKATEANRRVSQPQIVAVPASRVIRAWHFGTLFASLAAGYTAQSVRNAAKWHSHRPNHTFLSDANMNRIVSKLCRMRGAALKLGQILSIQVCIGAHSFFGIYCDTFVVFR